ncbi:hypothetical protein [Thiohalobacter sp.]|uniref:hypothetical protein n=1 Tax=Thiohalobacter sp. TaxID=2025948 RepID=UPI0026223080|nr:hypothetical protein [Thiohalobacter sp.]
MKIDNAAQIGLLGIQRGMAKATQHASEIASAGLAENPNPVALVEPLVGIKAAELQVKASAEVIKAVDDMIGTLFDDKA